MKSIALIEKNRCSFDDIEKYALPLLYQNLSNIDRKKIKIELNKYLWHQMAPYVKFIEINEKDNSIITDIINLIKGVFPDKNANDFYYHTEGSYSFPKKFIELIHAQPLWKEYENSQISNINNIGCLFSLSHTVIENNCILLANKYDLNAPNFVNLTNIVNEDITKVIRRRFFFTAILITDCQFNKYYYQNIDFLIKTIFNTDDIESVSFTIFKYNLKYYFKKGLSYRNKIATRIYGNQFIYGDVLVVHEMEDNIYANISVHELRRISILAYGSLTDRQLKPEENYELPLKEYDDNGKEYTKNVVPLWSRYIVIEKRMEKWGKSKNKCYLCNREIVDLAICNNCYRLKYCSKACMDIHNPEHVKDCITI